MARSVSAPKTVNGWGWLLCAAFAAYMFVLNGPNHKGERIRDEFVAGWNAGYNDDQPVDPNQVAQGGDDGS